MPKAYTLRVYNSVLQADPPAFQIDVTRTAKNWRHSIRSQGGYWQGSFQLQAADFGNLHRPFEEWLGYHVNERSGGVSSWGGMIYEMDLTTGGVRRRRSLDLMANRVRTTYLTLDYTGDNLVENPGFETSDGGTGAAAWTTNVGTSGTARRDATHANGGSASFQLNADTDGGEAGGTTYVAQRIQVTPGAKYQLTFYTIGDGVSDPDNYGLWYAVYDPNHDVGADWPVYPYPTYYTDHTPWKQYIVPFIGPGGGEVELRFYSPTGGNCDAWVDDVSILEEQQAVYETAWAQTAESKTRYGVKEEIIHLDNYPLATSEAYRDAYHAEHAWPWPRPVSAGPPGEDTLDVQVCGYVFTANHLYVRAGTGASGHVDDWITSIVGTAFGVDPLHGGTTAGAGDCQFLKVGNIASGDPDGDGDELHVIQEAPESRPWDVLLELAALGDADHNLYRVRVGAGRLLHYELINTTPSRFLRRDGLYDTMGGHQPTNPWLMQPCVVRDMSYRAGTSEPGSWLLSNQDFYVEEVEMADGWAQASLKTALFSESELLQAQAEQEGENG